MPTINEKLDSVPLVYTKKITESIKDDPEVVNLSRGESEFQAPVPIIDYLTGILSGNHAQGSSTDAGTDVDTGQWMRYGKTRGSMRLREAIARKYQRESGLTIDPRGILITQGGTNAIFTAFLAISNPGDEILIPDPAYSPYDPMVNHAIPGIKGKRVALEEADGFILTARSLDRAKTPQTKGLILTSPLNPTGTVYSKDQTREVMEWGLKNDVYIIHDENHEKEVYDGHKHYPISIYDPEFKNSVLLNSFSRLGMGGWRLGWMVASPRTIQAAETLHLYINMSCNSFVQEAGAYTLDNYEQLGFSHYFHLYRQKRDYLVKELNQLEGFSCPSPAGTCYAFPNVQKFYQKHKTRILETVAERLQKKESGPDPTGDDLHRQLELVKTSVSFAVHKYLLYAAGVGVIPGIAYGNSGDNCIRFSFSVKQEILEEAIRRLKKMYQQL
jgi:aspartate aminotransferase